MTPVEKEKRRAEITLELERLQMEYAALLARREGFAAELQQLSQSRGRLKKLRKSTPGALSVTGSRFNDNS